MQLNPISYSQWGDDVLVLEFFNQKKDGVFFEAGANDPKILSQTYLLEQHGWSGVLVEPVSTCCDSLRRERTRSHVFQNALGSPQQRGKLKLCIPEGITVFTRTLDQADGTNKGDTIIEADFITIQECLNKAGYTHLDYLSLDLEGSELSALHGLDFEKIRPRLIIIEDHLGELTRHNFLCGKGYKIVKRNGANNWYIPHNDRFKSDLISRIKIRRKLGSVWIRGHIRCAKKSLLKIAGLKS